MWIVPAQGRFTSLGKDGSVSVAPIYAERRDAEKRLGKLKLDDAAVSSLPLDEAMALRRLPPDEVGGTFVFQVT